MIHPDAIRESVPLGQAFAGGRDQAAGNVKAEGLIEDIRGHGNENVFLPGQDFAQAQEKCAKADGLLFSAAEIGEFNELARVLRWGVDGTCGIWQGWRRLEGVGRRVEWGSERVSGIAAAGPRFPRLEWRWSSWLGGSSAILTTVVGGRERDWTLFAQALRGSLGLL